jgi:hypothetical protein
MKKIWVAVVVALLCLPVLSKEKEPVTYQEGKVLSVDHMPSLAPSGGTDAPVAQSRDRYDISVQVGDTVYKVRYNVQAGEDVSWITGKTGQVRIKGKTMFVKRLNGTEAKASILSKSTAPNP